MVPAGVTGNTVDELAAHLEAGDIIIDGGNSYYRDDRARLLSDDRRRRQGRQAPRSDLQEHRARGRGRAAHACVNV